MLDFRYRLTGAGWAEADVSDGRFSVTLTASYLGDALSDLLDAAAALLDGSPGAACTWHLEPGAFRWVFERSGPDVHVSIFETRDVTELVSGGSRPEPDFGLVFHTQLPLTELAGAVASGAQAVLDQHGEAGYLAQWTQHPFPAEKLARLTAALR